MGPVKLPKILAGAIIVQQHVHINSAALGSDMDVAGDVAGKVETDGKKVWQHTRSSASWLAALLHMLTPALQFRKGDRIFAFEKTFMPSSSEGMLPLHLVCSSRSRASLELGLACRLIRRVSGRCVGSLTLSSSMSCR